VCTRGSVATFPGNPSGRAGIFDATTGPAPTDGSGNQLISTTPGAEKLSAEAVESDSGMHETGEIVLQESKTPFVFNRLAAWILSACDSLSNFGIASSGSKSHPRRPKMKRFAACPDGTGLLWGFRRAATWGCDPASKRAAILTAASEPPRLAGRSPSARMQTGITWTQFAAGYDSGCAGISNTRVPGGGRNSKRPGSGS